MGPEYPGLGPSGARYRVRDSPLPGSLGCAGLDPRHSTCSATPFGLASVMVPSPEVGRSDPACPICSKPVQFLPDREHHPQTNALLGSPLARPDLGCVPMK